MKNLNFRMDEVMASQSIGGFGGLAGNNSRSPSRRSNQSPNTQRRYNGTKSKSPQRMSISNENRFDPALEQRVVQLEKIVTKLGGS